MGNPNIKQGEFPSITNLDEDTSPASNDLIATWDTSAGFFKKVQITNLPGGGSGDTFTDRGDPAAWDFTISNFTRNGAWHDLDLSGIVPVSTKAVYICVVVIASSPAKSVMFRKNGNSNEYNKYHLITQAANIRIDGFGWVACDSNYIIEYLVTDTTVSTINFLVRGWLT